MPRIRTVKPRLFQHSALYDAEQATGLPIRLAYIGLFTCCDRMGRFKWDARELKLQTLPWDDLDFSRVLDAFVTRGFVVKYEVDGDVFGAIPTFTAHQVINNREAKSVIPPPPAHALSHKDSPSREPRVIHASGTRAKKALRGREGKGREGKGREEERKGKERKGKTALSSSHTPSEPFELVAQSGTLEGFDEGQLIDGIFGYWQRVMQTPRSKLSPDRTTAIKRALTLGYTAHQLCQAIRGCSRTPHNMGDNDHDRPYNELTLILRNASYIDRFIANDANPPRTGSRTRTAADRHKEVSEANGNAWLAKHGYGKDVPESADSHTIDMEP